MPFQQLLAVLPAASMELLPEAYRVTRLSYTCKICVNINTVFIYTALFHTNILFT